MQLGQEILTILDAGEYLAANGQKISIRNELERAVRGTCAYPPEYSLELNVSQGDPTPVEVRNETTLKAVFRLQAQRLNPVALNFASATHPGGGFLSGARAQEEYLARSSGLYACLKNQSMYAYNQRHADPLYSSYMLYSPDVPVIRAEDGSLLARPAYASLITAAAPNANRLPVERQVEIQAAFRERIAKVLAIGLRHAHNTIVLGAWGCGAFGNDGNMVSKLFQQALVGKFRGAYRKVVFAIVDWSDNERFIGPFKRTFDS